jgi:hypothetical protein
MTQGKEDGALRICLRVARDRYLSIYTGEKQVYLLDIVLTKWDVESLC